MLPEADLIIVKKDLGLLIFLPLPLKQWNCKHEFTPSLPSTRELNCILGPLCDYLLNNNKVMSPS